MPIIPKIVRKDDSETSGLLTIHGNGNEMINQITASKTYIFVFLFRLNNHSYSDWVLIRYALQL